jgi:hypothetical protein
VIFLAQPYECWNCTGVRHHAWFTNTFELKCNPNTLFQLDFKWMFKNLFLRKNVIFHYSTLIEHGKKLFKNMEHGNTFKKLNIFFIMLIWHWMSKPEQLGKKKK